MHLSSEHTHSDDDYWSDRNHLIESLMSWLWMHSLARKCIHDQVHHKHQGNPVASYNEWQIIACEHRNNTLTKKVMWWSTVSVVQYYSLQFATDVIFEAIIFIFISKVCHIPLKMNRILQELLKVTVKCSASPGQCKTGSFKISHDLHFLTAVEKDSDMA